MTQTSRLAVCWGCSSDIINMFLLYGALQGTLLILDEPTNHLDIPSKETLEEAVRQFEGAVIAVSHDRYFLKRIATRVLLVSREGVQQ
jgi:ATPase subunit of ABC transporter with duplicated ATPase domains